MTLALAIDLFHSIIAHADRTLVNVR
jgi:hypothetical protein